MRAMSWSFVTGELKSTKISLIWPDTWLPSCTVITVQVGSQVSGQIKEIFVDFNSPVTKDQLIARIDPETFEAKVNQAKAEVNSAVAMVPNQQAQVERSRADVQNARAALAEGKAQTAKAQVAVVDTKRDFDRKSALFKRELIANSDLDSSQAGYDSAVAALDAARAKEDSLAAGIGSAEAQLRVAQAQLTASQAAVEQKQASMQQAQVDLDHTRITAPVNGIVVSRQVDVGQTVAASLQAPVLFTIAQDLTRMQVETSVDEADIGRVRLDNPATFSVDAFPNATFRDQVTQIRKAAQIVQNVVTYTVVVAVPNPEGKLLPGMTANVKLVVAEKPNVLKVANASLRFRPPGESAEVAPTSRGGGGQSGGGESQGGGQGGGRGATAGRVWVIGPDGKPKAVAVRLGIPAGTSTEVVSGELHEGQEAIAGALRGANQPNRPSAPGGGGTPRLRL